MIKHYSSVSMKNLFQPPNEGKQKAKISLQTNNTIDTNNDTIKENTFSNFANIFKLPQRSPSSTREKILTMNRTNSSSNYNFNKNKNLANYTYDNYGHEEKDMFDDHEHNSQFYIPKQDYFVFSNRGTKGKNYINLKIKSKTTVNSNANTMNNSHVNNNSKYGGNSNYLNQTLMKFTSEKNMPIKLNHNGNYTIDETIPRESKNKKDIQFYNNSNNYNNMFLHFTNDVVQKRPKVNKSRCYNSFDVNDLNKSKETNSCTDNFSTIVSKITKIFQLEKTKNITNDQIIKRIKECNNLSNKVNDYSKYLPSFQNNKNAIGDTKKFLKNLLKKHEYYKKEVMLYKNLCENLIKKSNVNDLDELNAFINDKIIYSKINENFLENIKQIINEKYLETSNENTKNNSFHNYSTKKNKNHSTIGLIKIYN